MRAAMRMAVIPVIVLAASGCATKDWVKNLVGQKEAEIGQKVDTRVGAVEGRVGEQGQKVTWIEAKLGTVESTAGEARTRADAAHTRAETAQARAEEVNDRLSRLWSSRHKRQLVETVHVQFGFDKWELSDGAQTALLQIIKDLQANPNLSVDLEGYTDPTGPHAYNIGLSQRRVEAVRRFLIDQGAEMPRIHSVGRGPVNGKTEDPAKQRRVTLKLMLAQD